MLKIMLFMNRQMFQNLHETHMSCKNVVFTIILSQLWLDAGPGATIGGMCATRCSGSLAVRCVSLKHYLLN
jgi:hypothetical protein